MEKIIKAHVNAYWMEHIKDEAKTTSTLKHLQLDACIKDKLHPVWASATMGPVDVQQATIHVQLLVQRYPINSSHTIKNRTSPCPCCLAAEETVQHFKVECTNLATVHNKVVPNIRDILCDENINTTSEIVIQSILDPSSMPIDNSHINSVHSLTRELCFKLLH